MKTRLLLACLLIPWPVFAQVAFQQPNWDRAMAVEVVKAAETQTTLARLFQLAREDNDNALLEALSAIGGDTSLPDPAADYLLFSFAVGLSDLDAGSVSPTVLQFLGAYQPRTQVPLEDHRGVGVPLFNVRAAAAGARSAWERQQAGSDALRLSNGRPETWIKRYLAASPAGRRGFLEALAELSPGRLQALGQAAATQLLQSPELAPLVASAGIRSSDPELVWQSIEHGNSTDLPLILREAAGQFDATACAELLNRSLRLDSTTRKALAIAELGPVSMDDVQSQDALFESLESRELGAGAALVLSASADPQVQQRLTDLARKKDGLAGQRAALAISLRKEAAGALQ